MLRRKVPRYGYAPADAYGKHDVGLIAEEVGEIMPDMVTYAPGPAEALRQRRRASSNRPERSRRRSDMLDLTPN